MAAEIARGMVFRSQKFKQGVSMKITDYRCITLDTGWRNLTYLVLDTDAGVRGFGEAHIVGKTHTVREYLRDVRRHVIGHDVHDIESLYDKLTLLDFGAPGQVTMTGLALVEMACWDCIGRGAGRRYIRCWGARYVIPSPPTPTVGTGRRTGIFGRADSRLPRFIQLLLSGSEFPFGAGGLFQSEWASAFARSTFSSPDHHRRDCILKDHAIYWAWTFEGNQTNRRLISFKVSGIGRRLAGWPGDIMDVDGWEYAAGSHRLPASAGPAGDPVRTNPNRNRRSMNTSKDYTIGAVRKALQILKLFEKHDELTLMGISELTGMGKSSVLRLLYTLHREGFIAFNEDGKRYSLGLAVFQLGIRKLENLDFRSIALPRLKRMADETGLICYLGVEKENVLVMIEKVLPRAASLWAQLMAQPGGAIPLYSTGIGRLFLARRSDAEVRKYLDTVPLERFTADTITDRRALFELVRRARKEGVAFNQGENEPYISAICAPICDHKGTMVAGMSICGMKEMICGGDSDRLKALLLDAAHEISGELGFSGLRLLPK